MRSARSNTTTSCPARELLRGREPGGTGADHRDPLARLHRGVHRGDPPLVPRAVDDLDLDLLDRDGILVDAEHARRLTGRRAQAAGELGEVVGRVQALDGVTPVVAVHEVVPVGDEVPEGAAVVAERDAAVHAPTGLRDERLSGERLVDLVPVAQADGNRPAGGRLALPLEEAGGLTHARPPSPSPPSRRRRAPARPLRS